MILDPRCKNTIFRCPSERGRTNCPQNFWKEFRYFPGVRPYYSADFRPIGRNFDPDIVVTHKSKIQKMRFFSIFSKFVLDDSRYQISLPNHSRTPKMSFPAIYLFSGQYRPLWRKSYFWPKIIIFAKFDESQYGMEFGRNWPKNWKIFENVFSRPLRCF